MKSYSVVIPTQNRPYFLSQAIISVLKQTYAPKKIVIVDNSTNEKYISENKNLILNLKNVNDIEINYLFLKKCKNASEARNYGAKNISEKYIAFLDDDDYWEKHKIENQFAKINKDYEAVSSSFITYNNKFTKRRLTTEGNISNLKKFNSLGGCSGMLIKKSIFDTINGFDDSLFSSQDWDLWIRLDGVTNISICKKSKVFYGNHGGLKITTNYFYKYKGYRAFFLKHKEFINKRFIFFEIIIFRAKYYNHISFNNLLILLRLLNYQSKKGVAFLRTLKLLILVNTPKRLKNKIHNV